MGLGYYTKPPTNELGLTSLPLDQEQIYNAHTNIWNLDLIHVDSNIPLHPLQCDHIAYLS